MSYEHNLIVDYLNKISLLIRSSKTTESKYFYTRGMSFRYSNHWTSDIRPRQTQIIRKAHEIWIKTPWGKEYTYYNEKTGLYLLRRLIKRNTPQEDYKKKPRKYLKWKSRKTESRLIKQLLGGLKNDRLKRPENLIYVEERLYLK